MKGTKKDAPLISYTVEDTWQHLSRLVLGREVEQMVALVDSSMMGKLQMLCAWEVEYLSSWWLDHWWCGQQTWWTVGWVIDGQMRWQIVGMLSSSSGVLILYSTMQAGPCNPRGLDSSNHSWLEPRDASWCLHIELVLLFSVGADRSAKIEVFHITTAHCTWWFLSMNILLSFPFTSGVPCLSGWAIVLMHWWLINVVCAI